MNQHKRLLPCKCAHCSTSWWSHSATSSPTHCKTEELTSNTAGQALHRVLHVTDPVSVRTQPHELARVRAQRAQGSEEEKDHAGVVAHGAQHVCPAQHIVHGPQVVAKEGTDDQHHCRCCSQILQEEVLQAQAKVSLCPFSMCDGPNECL